MTKVHFGYVLLYMLSIVTFDTWNLIPHEGIVWRWQAATVLLAVNAICWYLARTKLGFRDAYKLVGIALIVADVIFAAYNVYWDRGIASPMVALFAVPVVLAAVLHSRRAILGAAVLAIGGYSLSCVKYFHLHYGEALKVQLYGTVLLFCGVSLVLAFLLMIIIKPQATDRNA
jgi:hypothetical protein